MNDAPEMARCLPPRLATMLSMGLQIRGYATGHSGSWHMGVQRDVGNALFIQAYGFNLNLDHFEGLGGRALPLKDSYDGKALAKYDLGSTSLGKAPIRREDRSRITTCFVDGASDASQVPGKAFYIKLWPDDIRSPFFPPRILRTNTAGNEHDLFIRF